MIEQILTYTLPAAFALLPDEMHTRKAVALLIAIGLQESRFEYRRQLGGPARGFWQFERSGVDGVLNHDASRPAISMALRGLRYPISQDVTVTHGALEHNDVLAACFARCLLWTLPGDLSGPTEVGKGWQLYTAAWRPGKPRQDAWQANYAIGWGAAREGELKA